MLSDYSGYDDSEQRVDIYLPNTIRHIAGCGLVKGPDEDSNINSGSFAGVSQLPLCSELSSLTVDGVF